MQFCLKIVSYVIEFPLNLPFIDGINVKDLTQAVLIKDLEDQ